MAEAAEVSIINEQKAQARQHRFRQNIGDAAVRRGEPLRVADVPLFALVESWEDTAPLQGPRDTRSRRQAEAAMFRLFLRGEEEYYIASVLKQSPQTVNALLRQVSIRVANYASQVLKQSGGTDDIPTIQTGIEAYWGIEFPEALDRRRFVARVMTRKFEALGGDFAGLLCSDNAPHTPLQPEEVKAQMTLRTALVDYLQLVQFLEPQDRPELPAEDLENLFIFLGLIWAKSTDGHPVLRAIDRSMSLMQYRSLARKRGLDGDSAERSLMDGLIRITTPINLDDVIVG